VQAPAALAPELVPAAVRAVLERLRAGGHAAHLVGGCVRDLVRARAAQDWDVATDAAPERVLELFPRAVPTGLHHGTVMVPTASGPVDVTRYRAGPRLLDDLAHRDFTVNALAWDPADGKLLDPFAGLEDLGRGCLRCVGDPVQRLAEDPLRALRAARFLAQLPLEPDPALERALPAAAAALDGVAPERLRAELAALLVAPRAGRALELLRRSGIEARLAPGCAPDAPAVVDALPPDLELRLAGWLRRARAAALLARLRFSRRGAERVERLLRLHPIEERADPAREATVRRLLSRAGEEDTERLLALREAELAATPDPAAAERVRALRRALERVRASGRLALGRRDLALDGAAVMETIGRGPGPHVGRALRALTERVLEDPGCNTAERLREILRDWWAREGSRER
jgi:tRNA nucleotidyltransferase (CCA-adding enzyme)